MRLTPLRRAAVLTLTAGALLGTSACFGSFNLTRKVYGWNKSVSSDKWVRELVFLGLSIVPVYNIAGLVDVLITNSIEFWTGTNPVSMSSTVKVDKDTKVVRVESVKNGVRTMTLTTYKFNKVVSTTTVEYVRGTTHMTFTTVQADGTSETHISAVDVNGKTFVMSGSYAELVRAGAVVEY